MTDAELAKFRGKLDAREDLAVAQVGQREVWLHVARIEKLAAGFGQRPQAAIGDQQLPSLGSSAMSCGPTPPEANSPSRA